MGGRGSSGGKQSSISFKSLGFKEVSEVDESKFNFFDIRYGSYARQLAEEANMVVDDEDVKVLQYDSGKNTAYAIFNEEWDGLEGLMSTGGGAGTQALLNLMKYQASRNKPLSWLAQNEQSIKYYDSLGLKKYSSGKRSKQYTIPATEMNSALNEIKKRKGN